MALPNIGKWVSDRVGFDPTPGFDIRRGPMPGVAINGVPRAVPKPKAPAATTARPVNQPVPRDDSVYEDTGDNYYDPYSDTSGYGGGTSGTTGPGYDVADAADEQAYWDDQIGQADSMLARLTNQRNIGYGNIDSSYNAGKQSLTNSRASAENQYKTTTSRAVRDNVQAKDTIGTQVGKQLTGLQRLLGARGAGQGSAAKILAPYSVGQQGNQRLSQVQQAYGDNMDDLQTNWGNTENQFTESFGQLDNDRNQKRRDLEARLAEKEAGLLETKGSAAQARSQAGGANYRTARAARQPYQSRIQQLLGDIDNLSANTSFQPKQVQYRDPTLRGYDYQQFGGNRLNTPTGTPTGPFANLIPQGSDEERKRQFGY